VEKNLVSSFVASLGKVLKGIPLPLSDYSGSNR